MVTYLIDSYGKATLVAFVEHYTEKLYFFPCTKEVVIYEHARLIVKQASKLHGMPEIIIFDYDPKFMIEL